MSDEFIDNIKEHLSRGAIRHALNYASVCNEIELVYFRNVRFKRSRVDSAFNNSDS